MARTVADYEMALRHVAEGERHVADQDRLVEKLRQNGQLTEMAVTLLAEIHDTLAMHRRHLEKIEAELGFDLRR